MATGEVKVVVEHYFEVEADTKEEVEKLAWEYENRATDAQVESIDVDEIIDTDDEDEDEDTDE